MHKWIENRRQYLRWDRCSSIVDLKHDSRTVVARNYADFLSAAVLKRVNREI
jgi:hypothetical protein